MLINIFGGIMKCDVIAEGVVAAAREVQLTVPLVVRLEGTNVELGKEILAQVGPAHHPRGQSAPGGGEGRRRGPGREGVMSILVDQNTRVLMQGITGSAGSFHAGQMLDYGTKLVAGVTPGKGGTEFQDRVPIFNTVADAVKQTGANVSVIFVPPPFAGDAILEAADAGVPLIIVITEGIPVMDMVKVKRALQGRPVRLVGPELPRGHHPRREVQDRHHARAHPQARADRRRLPLGHADLRGGVPAHAARAGPVDRGGHRR